MPLEIPNNEIGSCELNNHYGDLLPTMLMKEISDNFCVQQCSSPLCRQHCGSKVYLLWASVARFVTLKEARLFGRQCQPQMLRCVFCSLFQTNSSLFSHVCGVKGYAVYISATELQLLYTMKPNMYFRLARPTSMDGGSLTLTPCFPGSCCRHCGAQALHAFFMFLGLISPIKNSHI